MRILNTYREYVDPDSRLTEAEIVALCCAKVPVDPCSEVGRVSDYTGAEQKNFNFDPDADLAAARAANPNIRILSVRTEGIGPPPGMPCGKKHESWEGHNNCCEDVTPLSWDMNVTPDVLPHNSSIIIAWTGGTGGETTVTTSSNATWFDDGRKSATGYGTSIKLLSGETFCGATAVTVSDGCSEATVVIRSDLGQWVNRGPICALSGYADVDFLQPIGTWEKTLGKYRQVEIIAAPYLAFSDKDYENDSVYTRNPQYLPQVCADYESAKLSCMGVPNIMIRVGEGTTLDRYRLGCPGGGGWADHAMYGYPQYEYVYQWAETASLVLYEWTC